MSLCTLDGLVSRDMRLFERKCLHFMMCLCALTCCVFPILATIRLTQGQNVENIKVLVPDEDRILEVFVLKK